MKKRIIFYMVALAAGLGVNAAQAKAPKEGAKPAMAEVPPAPPQTEQTWRTVSPNKELTFQVDTIDIEVREGKVAVWKDSLRLNRYGSASYSYSLNQAPPKGCAPLGLGLLYNDQHLMVSLANTVGFAGIDNPKTQVTVSWRRPSVSEECGKGSTLSVQFTDQVQLVPGEAAILQGESGVSVKLTLRK